ncbi:MAG TPA: histidine phosphatase family protein [Allosphingosinicella sp.]
MARWFIARHGETVFNAAARMQGEVVHTPLTRAGFGHAEEIGEALLVALGPAPELTLWASPTGRALQTLAIAAEHLRLDWHQARTDARLSEMDMGGWGGRFYAEIAEAHGGFVDRRAGLFTCRPPGGEWYDDIARRLRSWLADTEGEGGDRLVVMHGISSRVLRGLLTGAPDRPGCGAPVAAPLPQGSVVCVENGVETVVGLGSGDLGASGTA